MTSHLRYMFLLYDRKLGGLLYYPVDFDDHPTAWIILPARYQVENISFEVEGSMRRPLHIRGGDEIACCTQYDVRLFCLSRRCVRRRWSSRLYDDPVRACKPWMDDDGRGIRDR